MHPYGIVFPFIKEVNRDPWNDIQTEFRLFSSVIFDPAKIHDTWPEGKTLSVKIHIATYINWMLNI